MQVLNLFGFVIGGFLYLMLGAMAVWAAKYRDVSLSKEVSTVSVFSAERLLVTVAVLGCLWNFGELYEVLWRDFNDLKIHPLISVLFYSALGFVPALLVHFEKQNEIVRGVIKSSWIIATAYLLSACASLLHVYTAVYRQHAPSNYALFLLAIGYLIIAATIFVQLRDDTFGSKASRVAALVLFAVLLIHLGFPHEEGRLWYIEIIGHQASLPLIVAVLYRNFRFSFADLFLKRACSLVILAGVVFLCFELIILPINTLHSNHPENDPQKIGIFLIVWILTALAYPLIYRFASYIVDKSLLRRPDYALLERDFVKKVLGSESIQEVLEETARAFKSVMNAQHFKIGEVADVPNFPLNLARPAIEFNNSSARILIPAVENPSYEVLLKLPKSYKQMLSEEIETLETIKLQAARRIDVLRVAHVRCESEFREKEFSNLATEAELRALRSQINPHFLFNALTTIGYLINTSPEKALALLLKLTGLLRGVLRSTNEFQTLGQEMALIESYLLIEKARFEERLQIEIDIPVQLANLRIPSLLLQPIVENAVKHGISPRKDGGVVRIAAEDEGNCLVLRVSDSGSGVEMSELRRRIQQRVGLKNVERRLNLNFGERAELRFESSLEHGMLVEIRIDDVEIKKIGKDTI